MYLKDNKEREKERGKYYNYYLKKVKNIILKRMILTLSANSH